MSNPRFAQIPPRLTSSQLTPRSLPPRSPSSSLPSHQHRLQTSPYLSAPLNLQKYRTEPIFDSDDSDPESEEAGPGFLENLKPRVECWKVALDQKISEPMRRKTFEEVLEEQRDGLLEEGRRTERELWEAKRRFDLDKRVKDAYASWKEQKKRARRVEDRWHQHRLAEEDSLRYRAIRADYEQLGLPDIEIGPEHDVHHEDFKRQYRGFELGVIGGNNTVAHRTVIPSLEEILYPALPDPHKRTIEDPPTHDVRDDIHLPPPRANPIPFMKNGDDDVIGELMMQLDEVDRMLEQARRWEGVYKGSEQEKVVRRLVRERRRIAEELGRETLEVERARLMAGEGGDGVESGDGLVGEERRSANGSGSGSGRTRGSGNGSGGN